MDNSKVRSKVISWLQPQYDNPEMCDKYSASEYRDQYSEIIQQHSDEFTSTSILKDFRKKSNKAKENNVSKDKSDIIISKQHTEEGGKILKNDTKKVTRNHTLLENKDTVTERVLETSLKKKTGLSINNGKLDDETKIPTSRSFQDGKKHKESNNKRMTKPNHDIRENKIFNEFILVLKENQQFIDTKQHDTKEHFLTIMKDCIDTQNELSSSRTSQQTRKRKDLKGCKKIVDFDSHIDIREYRGSSPVAQKKMKDLHKKLNFGDNENIE